MLSGLPDLNAATRAGFQLDVVSLAAAWERSAITTPEGIGIASPASTLDGWGASHCSGSFSEPATTAWSTNEAATNYCRALVSSV
jgi:hypothetical protein